MLAIFITCTIAGPCAVPGRAYVRILVSMTATAVACYIFLVHIDFALQNTRVADIGHRTSAQEDYCAIKQQHANVLIVGFPLGTDLEDCAVAFPETFRHSSFSKLSTNEQMNHPMQRHEEIEHARLRAQ